MSKTVTKSIVKATGVILVMNIVVKLLGFLRETFLASAFGASYLTDAYLSAYTIPYFLQAILGSALVTVVVPILTPYLTQNNKKEAWQVASGVLNLTAIALVVITILGMLSSDYLVKLLAPGFNAEQSALTSQLTFIMFPAVIFMGLGMVITGILNANYRFAAGAFAPGFSSIIIILSIILFSSTFGIVGLAWGTVISFLGFLLIQIPSLIKTGFKYEFKLYWKHPAVKRVAKEILPIVLGVAVNQIYFLLNRIFASGLAEGSIAVLNFGNKIMMLPLGVFVAAVASAIYPSLSEFAVKRDFKQMNQTLFKGLGLVSLISIPAAIGLGVLSVPIVELLFERGNFDHAATINTAQALTFYAIGLFPMAANMVLNRAYYAVHDVKTPVYTGLISIVANLILSFILIRHLSASGLALANSLAAFINMALMYFVMRRKFSYWESKNYWLSTLKIIIAAVIMGFVTKLLMNLLINSGILIQVAVAIIGAVIAYVILIFIFKVDEAKYCMDIVKRKFKKAG